MLEGVETSPHHLGALGEWVRGPVVVERRAPGPTESMTASLSGDVGRSDPARRRRAVASQISDTNASSWSPIEVVRLAQMPASVIIPPALSERSRSARSLRTIESTVS